MGNRIEKWKYFGLDKEEVLKYRDTVSLDNLKVLNAQCIVMAIFLFIVGPVLLITTADYLKGLIITASGVYFTALYLVVHKNIDPIKKTTAARADLLVFLFSLALYLLCLYIGTIDMDGYPAVTLVAILLFIQIDFDTLPHRNLSIILVALIVFLTISYFYKDSSAFIYDAIDATLGTALGLFVSWQKARIKWEHVIDQGKLKEVNYKLYHACITDELTKLPNRRQVFEGIENEYKNCLENGTLLVCIVMDIDQFMEFNDTYGHPQGDVLLQKLGGLLKQLSRSLDIKVGRIGGEEFMFYWEENNADRAYSVAEQIRLSVQNIPHPARKEGATITVSMGVSVKTPFDDFVIEDAYREADDAMYHAKRSGKNTCWRYYSDTNSFASIK